MPRSVFKKMSNTHRIKPRSIIKRFSLSLTISFVAIAAITLIVSFFFFSHKIGTELNVKIDRYLNDLSEVLKIQLWNYNDNAIQTIGNAYIQNDFINSLTIEGSDGQVLFKAKKSSGSVSISQHRDIKYSEEIVGRVEIDLTGDYYKKIYADYTYTYVAFIILMLIATLSISAVLLRLYFKKPFDHFCGLIENFQLSNSTELNTYASFVEFQPLVAVLEKMKLTIATQMQTLKLAQYAIDNCSVAIFWINPEGRIKYANKKGHEWLGYLPEGLEELSILEIDTTWSSRTLDDIIRQLEKGGTLFESVYRTKHKKEIPVAVSANYFKYLKQEFIFLFVSDITERKGFENSLIKAKQDLERRVIERTHALKQSEQHQRSLALFLEKIMEESPVGITIYDSSGQCIMANETIAKLINTTKEQVLSQNYNRIGSWEKSGLMDAAHEAVKNNTQKTIELSVVSSFGKPVHLFCILVPFKSDDEYFLLVNFVDVSHRKTVEEKIKTSLKEKEVLLREIHHRVKNNLSVIISLLNLQAHQFDDDRISSALQDSRDRIESMALIHNTLYQSNNFSGIYLDEYIPNLGNQLMRVYRGNKEKIRMTYEIDNIVLELDQAIPCGLILNELFTNALKHAFPKTPGEIRITAHYTDTKEIRLVFQDYGVGLPEGLDTDNSDSMGLKIVSILTKNQLEGNLEIRSQDGVRFEILIPLPTSVKPEA